MPRRIALLQRPQDTGLGGRAVHGDFLIAAGELPQMGGKLHADHERVCTSTDSTAGRSRTIGAQLSPESGEAYTCPPVVPK